MSTHFKIIYNLTRIRGTLHEDQNTFLIKSRCILLRMRNVSDKSCRENQNTRFVFDNVFPKIVPLRGNVEKYGRSEQTTDNNVIRRMRFACRITKATDTHLEYVTLIVFPWHQSLRERSSILHLHVHCLSCLVINLAVYKVPTGSQKIHFVCRN